jgi:flagellar protein FliS
MFLSSGYGAAAHGRYQAVDVDSQVEGASPHQLVAILFDELTKAIDIMLAAQRVGNRMKVIDKQGRASNILLALETSLDFRNGGDLALNLAQVYRESRRLVQLGGRGADAAPIEEARKMIGEIADAWKQIA